ncbi:MAG: hypothetical protein QM802_11270 [Agriterribacter sp.]
MKLCPLLCLLFFSVITESCKNKGEDKTNQEQGDSTTKNYYPVTSYINGQIMYLDSVPLAIIKYTISNNKIDTSITEKKDFAAIAAQFASPDISKAPLKDQYEETSFMDATLGTISLTYAAKNDTSSIRKIDVLLKQENTDVSTIYVEKKTNTADSAVTKKMLWTAGKNLLVTTLIQKKNEPEKVIQERYVWNDVN